MRQILGEAVAQAGIGLALGLGASLALMKGLRAILYGIEPTDPLTLAAVAIFLFISGVFPGVGWLELLPLLVIVTLLGAGLGLLLSVLYVRFRDMAPIWDVIGQMLFYASPIIYTATTVPAEWQKVYLCNPIAAVLTQMRHVMLDPDAPSTATLMGGTVWLLIPLGIVLASFALGVWAFIREAPKVAENL